MVIDQFDEILDPSRQYPLVFAVWVHRFIISRPFRLSAFRDAARHIPRFRDRLWITTPGEVARISRACRKHDPGICDGCNIVEV